MVYGLSIQNDEKKIFSSEDRDKVIQHLNSIRENNDGEVIAVYDENENLLLLPSWEAKTQDELTYFFKLAKEGFEDFLSVENLSFSLVSRFG